MRTSIGFLLLCAGFGLGAMAVIFSGFSGRPATVGAASNDRYQDYVMTTGAVNISPKLQTDGVWLLDYKSGKLLGTVIDKAQGKMVGWAEVDLVSEFEVAPKQDVHFMMTTGWVSAGQSALYIAETTTGKFGVYTMAPAPQGNGVVILRHDLGSFRAARPLAPAAPAPAAPAPAVPPAAPAPAVPPAAPDLAVPALPDIKK
jgi:hypothetical protein